MLRAYSLPLRPLAHQRSVFAVWLQQCCTLYNAALEQRIMSWKKHRRTTTLFQQQRELTDLRQESEWKAVPALVQRSALHRLDCAYKGFFQRVQSGQKPGFPRFRSRDRYDSFGVGRAVVDRAAHEKGSGYVHVPKLGPVRFKQSRTMRGEVRDVTVYKNARGRWFVRIVCDIGEAPSKRLVRESVGVDLGLKSFAVLSDGTAISNPRWFRQNEDRLANRQRVLARRRRGSRSYNCARVLVAYTYEKARNQRLDFHRKLAKSLVARYDLIVHEKLRIRGLLRGHLAKSISDAGWRQFISILHSKAEEAGVYAVAVDPQGTSQLCSACGCVVPKGLSERVHRCACGLILDRDHNAALNILARGLRAMPSEGMSKVFAMETEPVWGDF